MKSEYKFQVEALRKLPDPVNPEKWERYYAICNVKNLPDDFPMETNPRKQNLGTKVAKKIHDGLTGEETGQMFHLLNRGILLSAENVAFNNSNNEVTILMSNHEVHGLVDGGHSYKIILDNRSELTREQFITIEILKGIHDDFQEIAGARNTSVQVKEKSLAELEGKLGVVHQIVASEPFAQDIAYVENDDKPIDVQEIICLLTIFHNELHAHSHPVYTYSSKGRALQVYLENNDSYRKLIPVSNKIFALHDHIKNTMGDVYNKQGGNFGNLKEIGYSKGRRKWPLLFSPRKNGAEIIKIQYDVPSGFVYPLLGALRFLLSYSKEKGSYEWKTDPIEYYNNSVGEKLVTLTFDASTELGRNPMAVGKSSRHWEGLYNYVAATFLQQKK